MKIKFYIFLIVAIFFYDYNYGQNIKESTAIIQKSVEEGNIEQAVVIVDNYLKRILIRLK